MSSDGESSGRYLGWLCEDCPFRTQDRGEAWDHSRKEGHKIIHRTKRIAESVDTKSQRSTNASKSAGGGDE